MADTLYYDGRCPLCRHEIDLLGRWQTGGLNLADIHTLVPNPQHPDREALLRRLHLRTDDGRWLVGLDATVRAWSHTPFGALLRPLRWPGLRRLADHLYTTWAHRRYQRRYDCTLCSAPTRNR
ncbi:thiol-disulfide oxidoreductase DCC family protein [Marinobacter sp. JSM 1782161]|uniref:thiol-disulfide oxidoreductase DCC family protein n=1 Tax=Marinobacter sp. JSM 1782161 TaxID=2685906 RepID=UPI001403ECBD|nr:DUF393 domain-containing protein [Marinobacter sp. JSM 1782161]